MTVAELLEVLAAAPRDALVLVADEAGDVVDLQPEAVLPVYAVDDGTGIYATRKSAAALERWRARNAPSSRIEPALVLSSNPEED
jgi:hypothetical protein